MRRGVSGYAQSVLSLVSVHSLTLTKVKNICSLFFIFFCGLGQRRQKETPCYRSVKKVILCVDF